MQLMPWGADAQSLFWSLVIGHWFVVRGRWSVVGGRWSVVAIGKGDS